MYVTSSKSLLIEKTCEQVQLEPHCSPSGVTCRTQVSVQLHLIRPQLKLLAFQPMSSLQFTERTYIHVSHISDLVINVMFVFLPVPSWPLPLPGDTGMPQGTTAIAADTGTLSSDFFPSMAAGRKPLILPPNLHRKRNRVYKFYDKGPTKCRKLSSCI